MPELTKEIVKGEIYRVEDNKTLMDGELVLVYFVEDFRDIGYFIFDSRAWCLPSASFADVTPEEIEAEYEPRE